MLSLFQGPPNISWDRAPKKVDTALSVALELSEISSPLFVEHFDSEIIFHAFHSEI